MVLEETITGFEEILIKVKMKDADGKKLFKDLRTAMGIKSQKGFGVQMKSIMSLEDF